MRRIIVTGVNRGLGKELFCQFVAKNYFVYGVLKNKSDYAKLQVQIPENSKLILADLSSDDSIISIQESVRDNPIDLLINNAGIGGRAFKIENIDTSEIHKVFNIHCLGVVRTVKALRSNLLTSKEPIVVNINSRFGSITRQDQGVYQDLATSYSYRIAKAAQNMLTVCLRNEFKNNIQFISLHPGKLKTKIASIDADIEPKEIATRILEFYEQNKLKAENGIVELCKEVIEW